MPLKRLFTTFFQYLKKHPLEKTLKYHFKNKDYFNRKELQKILRVDENKMMDLLKWNARLHLGNEIKSCIEKKGHCHFEAEL